LSDEYFVDPNAGLPRLGSGSGGFGTASAGTGGSAPTAGMPAKGGKSGKGAGAGDGSGATGQAGKAGAETTAGTGGGSSGTAGRGMGGTNDSAGASDAGATGEAGKSGSGGSEPGCIAETERCDGVDNDCDDAIDEDSVCPDSCAARRYDDHLYLLCVATDPDDRKGCNDASSLCTEIGTSLELVLPLGLAWIESPAENEFLKAWAVATAPIDGVVWMAANDESEESSWVWGRRTAAERFFTGDPSGGGTPYMDRFNDWAPRQPDGASGPSEDCGAFDSQVGWRWSDRPCSQPEVGFVCEEHPPQ
jgi:hypothetical protein